MNQNILITGGAGFIGKHLTQNLIRTGYRVTVLDNLSEQIHGVCGQTPEWLTEEGITFVKESVLDSKFIDENIADYGIVIHLAAETGTGQSMYEIVKYNEVNVTGTARLLQSIIDKNHKPNIILSSSRSIYGEGAYSCKMCQQNEIVPKSRLYEDLNNGIWDPICEDCGTPLLPRATGEDSRPAPASIYAATKLSQEHLLQITCDSNNLPYTIFRFQNVYGEGQSLKNPYTGILSIFSTKIRRGLPLPIFEDGEETRDFIHVDDVVRGIVKAIDRPANTTLNLGFGVPTKIADAASALSRAMNAEPNLIVTGEFRLGDIRHNYADMNKTRQLLDFAPQIDLEAGFKRFSDWVNTQELPEDKVGAANSTLAKYNLIGRSQTQSS